MRFSRLGLLLLITFMPFWANAFTNVIGPGGTLVAWGDLVLPYIEPGTHFKDIATGGNHVLALKDDGTVVAWGNNTWNQCIIPEAASQNTLAIGAGTMVSTALLSDGTAMSWGGVSETEPYIEFHPASKEEGLSNIVSIAVSGSWSYGLRKDGSVIAWIDFGQALTNGIRDVRVIVSSTALESAKPAIAIRNDGTVATLNGFGFSPVAGISNAAAVALSFDFLSQANYLVLSADGSLKTWGSAAVPSIPAGLSNVVGIAAGEKHYVALRSNGTVVAWGDNSLGQTNSPPGLSNVVKIVAGLNNCVALKSDGTVVAWGYNSRKLMTAGLTDVVQATSGQLLRSDGTLTSWEPISHPLPVGLSNIVAIPRSGVGAALRSDGTAGFLVYAHGTDGTLVSSYGDLGISGAVALEVDPGYGLAMAPTVFYILQNDGTVINYGGSRDVSEIAANTFHALLRKRNGTLVSLGIRMGRINFVNGLTYSEQATVPPDLSNVVAIAVGSSVVRDDRYSQDYTYQGFSLALKQDGTVVAWDGWLPSPDVTNVVAIAAGAVHGLALRSDGTVYAWDRSTNEANYKMVPKGLTNVIAINAAEGQSFAIVATPPTISKQPVSKQIVLGLKATFSAEVKGTTPFTYQWFHNDTALAGQTNLSLTISNAQSIAAGSYTVHVKGRGGSVVSAAGILAISNSISVRVVSQGVELTTATGTGKTYTFEVSPGLNGPWSSLGSQSPGTGSPIQVIAPLDQGSSARFYRVRYNVP